MLRRLQLATRSQRGQMSGVGVVGLLLLIVAYLTDPTPFNHFVHWLLHDLFGTVRSSFGGSSHHSTAGSAGTSPAHPAATGSISTKGAK
jgi:hypothetical protein